MAKAHRRVQSADTGGGRGLAVSVSSTGGGMVLSQNGYGEAAENQTVSCRLRHRLRPRWPRIRPSLIGCAIGCALGGRESDRLLSVAP
eukprot:7241254-Pyramimonas_sp.AAC.1